MATSAVRVVKTVKLDLDEDELVKSEAAELGMYDHGVMRAAVRFVLGLPVAPHVERYWLERLDR